MKKLISVVLLIISFSILSLGCLAKKDISAEQTSQALYNLYILSDGKEVKKIGFTDDDINGILEQRKTNEIRNISFNFSNAGLPITDEELDTLYQLQQEALKKLTPDISIESESEDEIIVKLSTNYIDIVAIDNQAALDAIAMAEDQANAGTQLSNSELSKLYIENLIKNLESIEPSAKMLDATFKFTKQKFLIDKKAIDFWAPEDPQAFAQKVIDMTVGVDY